MNIYKGGPRLLVEAGNSLGFCEPEWFAGEGCTLVQSPLNPAGALAGTFFILPEVCVLREAWAEGGDPTAITWQKALSGCFGFSEEEWDAVAAAHSWTERKQHDGHPYSSEEGLTRERVAQLHVKLYGIQPDAGWYW